MKSSYGIPTVNSDHLTQFIEANDLIPMNGYLRQKTNQLPTFRGPNERVTRLDLILSKNIDKSQYTKINNVMPKIVRSDHTVHIANIDIKWKRFLAKIAPKTDWSQLGNTNCRSRFVENFQKSRDVSLDFLNAVHYASNALPVKKRRSLYLWYDNPEFVYARRHVQSCTVTYRVSSRQYTDVITNLEALHPSAATQTATEPFSCISAASIADCK